MRRILDALILVTSCVLGVVAQQTSAHASVFPKAEAPSGAGMHNPLLGGLSALGFWWFWRRWRRPDKEA